MNCNLPLPEVDEKIYREQLCKDVIKYFEAGNKLYENKINSKNPYVII